MKISLDEINIEISHNKQESIQFAELAIEKRLYVDDDGYKFKEWLRMICQETLLCDLGIAYHDDSPVGLCIVLKEKDNEDLFWTEGHLGVYIIPEYRMNGIGKMLVNAMKDNSIHRQHFSSCSFRQ